MQIVFTKNEDNVNEIFANLRNSAFYDFIEEQDDESDFESGEDESAPSSSN